MKKAIKIFLMKLEDLKETKEGTLQGGFASIKGGFESVAGFADNFLQTCTNTKDCKTSTNTGGCVNSGSCFT